MNTCGPVMKPCEQAFLCAETDEAFKKTLDAMSESDLKTVIQWLHYPLYEHWPKVHPEWFAQFCVRVQPYVQESTYFQKRLLQVCVRTQLVPTPTGTQRFSRPSTPLT